MRRRDFSQRERRKRHKGGSPPFLATMNGPTSRTFAQECLSWDIVGTGKTRTFFGKEGVVLKVSGGEWHIEGDRLERWIQEGGAGWVAKKRRVFSSDRSFI